ncbi:TVP38/TMEM64 family protein [Candidatus Woesearchaeota archaeon]|nr:TVP38/TMEM64 family protein [Candidatus Woesearchaeota archaeon]
MTGTTDSKRGWTFSRSDWFNIATLIALLAWAALSYLGDGVVRHLVRGDVTRISDTLISLHPVQSALLFILLVIIEVVIGIIPGALIYPLGGLFFGWAQGILYVSAGNAIGAAISYSYARSIAERFTRENSRFVRAARLLRTKGTMGLFLLRLNPLTSYDILSYVAGAIRLPFWPFIAATMAGLLPAIVVTTILGDAFLGDSRLLVQALFAAIAVYTVYLAVWHVWLRHRPTRPKGI